MLRLIARVHGALIAALMAAALLATAWPAGAQEQVRAVFDIPAQSLSGALVEYSRQSGVVVVVPAPFGPSNP